MRKLYYLLSVIFLIGITSSCKDYLNLKPLGAYSDADVWQDQNLVETFINDIYKNALGWPFAIERLSDYCDESCFTPDWGAFDFDKCLMTSDGLMGWNYNWDLPDPTMQTYHYQWAPLYTNVRKCNLFFSHAKSIPWTDDDSKNHMMGEVYFLRAYNYHYLAALYGGVPLITKAYGLGEDYSVKRNTYEECVNYIVGRPRLSCSLLLPTTYASADRGRATKGAALTLKARTLLYAASDLHNSTSIATYAAGFAHPELLGDTSEVKLHSLDSCKSCSQGCYGFGSIQPLQTRSGSGRFSCPELCQLFPFLWV